MNRNGQKRATFESHDGGVEGEKVDKDNAEERRNSDSHIRVRKRGLCRE